MTIGMMKMKMTKIEEDKRLEKRIESVLTLLMIILFFIDPMRSMILAIVLVGVDIENIGKAMKDE